MAKDLDMLDELLGMAKEPDQFTKGDLGDMILVAATEIIKLRGFGSLTKSVREAAKRRQTEERSRS